MDDETNEQLAVKEYVSIQLPSGLSINVGSVSCSIADLSSIALQLLDESFKYNTNGKKEAPGVG